jgi:hypothetical protein
MNAFIFMYIAKGSVILPLAYCILKSNKKNKTLLVILALLSVSVITEIANEVYIRSGNEGVVLYNIYTLFEFVYLSLLYVHLLPHRRRVIYTITIFYIIFYIGNSIWIETIQQMQNYPLLAESGIVILYSLIFFKHLFNTLTYDPPILRNGQFWIAIAFSVYFMYSIGLFAMANYIFTKLEPDTARAIWNVHNINYIIRNIILTWGIYCIAKANPSYRERFGMKENWRENMPSNPHLQALQEEE